MNNWKKEKFGVMILKDGDLSPVLVDGITKNGIGICRDESAISNRYRRRFGYTITHLASGLLILHGYGKAKMKKKAELILQLTDWTKEACEVIKVDGLAKKVYGLQ